MDFDKKKLKEIDAERDKWKDLLKATEKKRPPRNVRFTTLSDMDVPLLSDPTDLESEGFDFLRDLGYPGQYPYTRGIYPNMYRGKVWTIRQFAGFSSARDTNARFRKLLEQGQTGLSTAFDMPTLMGYDADSPLSLGEVGRCGVSISCLRDMDELFDQIPLDQVTTSMTINGPAIVILSMYLALAEKRGVAKEKVRGTLQNDILKEYIAQKEWLFPIKPAVELVTDTVEYCTRHYPNWNTISISGYHIREAGATAVQEAAFTIADGLAYVDSALERGMSVDEFAPRLSFFFDVHNDFFEEIAKFRAARRVWARLMRERYQAKDPRSWLLRTHAQTAGVSLTAQQPYNNIARVTVQALAGVLGGVNSLHTNSMDETLSLPTEEAAMIALRTQQIIAEESGITNVADPLGGSYFVESMTNRIEKDIMKYIDRIDELGGMVNAIEEGFPQSEIANSAYRYQRQLEKGEKVIVGVNRFKVQEEECSVNTLYIEKKVEEECVRKLKAFKQSRGEAYKGALKKLKEKARLGNNLMEPTIEAVKADATLQEVCDAMREVFGTYRETEVF